MSVTHFSAEFLLAFYIVLLLCFSLLLYKGNEYVLFNNDLKRMSLYMYLNVFILLALVDEYYYSIFIAVNKTSGVRLYELCLVCIFFLVTFVTDETRYGRRYLVITVLTFCVLLGLILSSMANNLMLLFISVELASLGIITLCGITNKSTSAYEAALTYFFSACISSSVMLIGFAIIYYSTGTMHLSEINIIYSGASEYIDSYQLWLGQISFFCITCSFCIKLYLFPGHLWAFNVYHNIDTNILLLLGIPVFLTSWILYIRIFSAVTNGYLLVELQYIFYFCGIISMIIGLLSGIWYRTPHRLVASNSILISGTFLLILSVNNYNALSSFFVYYCIYLVTLLLLGLSTLSVESLFSGSTPVTIADLGALYKENSLLSFLCSILLFSLTGLPPFAGFFLKVELLTNIMSSYFFSTIIILTVVGTFSAFYYIRIIKGLYYEKSTTWLVFNKNINFFSIATCIFLILILNTLFIYNIGAVIHFCLELFTVVYIY